MNGTANLSGASTFSSTYTIPDLANCGLATTALNLVIPGPGNTFSAVVQPPPSAPAVSTDPASQTVANGAAYSFAAAASGYPAPAQQWQVSTDGGSTFTNISGATGATYSGTGALSDSGQAVPGGVHERQRNGAVRRRHAHGGRAPVGADHRHRAPPAAVRRSSPFTPGASDGGTPGDRRHRDLHLERHAASPDPRRDRRVRSR